MYTLHSEVALFPVSFGERGLRQASFKIAFPPEFLDQLRLLVDLGIANTTPLAVRGARKGQTIQVAPREVLVALLQQRASALPAGEPNDCDVLRVVAAGRRADVPVELTEEMVVLPYKPWSIGAGDLDTGVPLAIAGILLASGEARLPGAHGAERVFDPAAFLRELARYGMHAHETLTRAIS
jgi:saccharopine dehydrogenase-like NADP-dependent oxidoreductase